MKELTDENIKQTKEGGALIITSNVQCNKGYKEKPAWTHAGVWLVQPGVTTHIFPQALGDGRKETFPTPAPALAYVCGSQQAGLVYGGHMRNLHA